MTARGALRNSSCLEAVAQRARPTCGRPPVPRCGRGASRDDRSRVPRRAGDALRKARIIL